MNEVAKRHGWLVLYPEQSTNSKLTQMLEQAQAGIADHTNLLNALIANQGEEVSKEHCKGMGTRASIALAFEPACARVPCVCRGTRHITCISPPAERIEYPTAACLVTDMQ